MTSVATLRRAAADSKIAGSNTEPETQLRGVYVPAQEGDTVAVRYELTLQDGTIFESNLDGSPLLLTIGAGDVLPGFEQAIIGLEPGEHALARITPDEAYGPRFEEVVEEVPIELFGEGAREIGSVVTVIGDDGSRIGCRVVAVSDDLMTVTVDFNHPLAGELLTYDIELVEIVP